MVNQVRMLGGKWSMKISHSAKPRNRSSRNSRSPAAGSTIAGAAVAAASSSAPLASTGGPAIGSAIDVIRHRVGKRTFAPTPVENDNIGPQLADNIQRLGRRRRALEWNYVKTAMEMTAGWTLAGIAANWFL